jgi:hypothetical protein
MPQPDEMTWKPLAEIALKYADRLREAAPAGAGWRDALNELPDHNQTMIDCIEEESPGLDAAITEMMETGTESASAAWTGLVNHLFDLAREAYDGG